MLGWDVGYVWPLLESAVAPQSNRPLDSWQLVMGNPHEAAQASNASGETSATAAATPAVPARTPAAAAPRIDPPPYESVANESSEQSGVPTATSQTRNSSVSNTAADGGRRHRTSSSRATRTRSGNGGSQRMRPPKWPHKASSVFACLSCVIGVCNVSRFSMLVYIFKGKFFSVKVI